jgi:hypothetical protein
MGFSPERLGHKLDQTERGVSNKTGGTASRLLLLDLPSRGNHGEKLNHLPDAPLANMT